MTDNTQTVKGIMARYERDMELSSRIAMAAKEDAGERLRHLLLPILNRWGLGMKKGGALLYLNPNIEGEDVVEVDKDCDYVLGELHDELAAALWEELDTDGGTLHDFIEDIDIPQSDGADGGVHYVWIAARGEHLETVSMTASWGHEPSDVLYYGPVTREFIEDVGGIDNLRRYALDSTVRVVPLVGLDVDAVLDSLPKYKAGDIEWERVLDGDESTAPPSTPGLLVDGVASNEPLSKGCTLHTLYYDSNSPPVRDVDIDDVALSLRYKDVHTSTALVVEATLCHMMEGGLPPTNVLIEGQPLNVREQGSRVGYCIVIQHEGYPTNNYPWRLAQALIDKFCKGVL